MNLLAMLLCIYVSCSCKETTVKVLEGDTNSEVFNAIESFNQYHSSTFKLNLFESTNGQSDEEGNKGVQYIFGINSYDGSDQVFQAGTFYSPEIMHVSRKSNSLVMELEHGHYDHRVVSLITVTSDNVEIAAIN